MLVDLTSLGTLHMLAVYSFICSVLVLGLQSLGGLLYPTHCTASSFWFSTRFLEDPPGWTADYLHPLTKDFFVVLNNFFGQKESTPARDSPPRAT